MNIFHLFKRKPTQSVIVHSDGSVSMNLDCLKVREAVLKQVALARKFGSKQ